MVFIKLRGWILTSVFSIVGTTIGVQTGYIGPNQSFLSNLMSVTIVYIVSRALSYVISRD